MAWHTEQLTRNPGFGSNFTAAHAGQIAEEVLGKEFHYGAAFAYLFRRFGFPAFGSDPHKDLVKYLLTTPMQGAYIEVNPCVSTLTSFYTVLGRGLSNRSAREEMKFREQRTSSLDDPASLASQIKLAIKETVQDLLIPVYVQDWYFNIQGRVADARLADYPTLEEVEYSDSAGQGIPPRTLRSLMRSKH